MACLPGREVQREGHGVVRNELQHGGHGFEAD